MIKMRQQFVNTIADVIKKDKKLALLLGDIGYHGFRQVFADHPERTYNIGILEQATVSVASGLAMTGMIPVVHTIAPFLVERAFEQLKVDFGYQQLNGNFVSVGASYDYAGLGCTHHCPGDVGILKNIPNMSIMVAGTAKEFDLLFKESYAMDDPKYFRLSESSNEEDRKVKFGKALVVKKGHGPIVVAVGQMLQPVLEATKDMEPTILYYTTIRPFDSKTLRANFKVGRKIVVCEPYYEGGMAWEVTEAIKPGTAMIEYIGVPHRFLNNYGVRKDHDKDLGLDADGIKKKISAFLKK